MRALLVALLLIPATSHAGDERMNLAIGAGVDLGATPGWAVRFTETIEMSPKTQGLIYGSTCGYDYWRGADGNGFHIPIGGYVGVRAHSVTSTFGAGVGVLAFESFHDDRGFGIVPHIGTNLGFELDETRTASIDARAARHVLARSPDFTRWSVLVMIGKTLGR